jgi:hypothetical protein
VAVALAGAVFLPNSVTVTGTARVPPRPSEAVTVKVSAFVAAVAVVAVIAEAA